MGLVAETPSGERPSAPGAYDVVVVGSGPGGLQAAYFLGRLGLHVAILSADAAPGGAFLKWPIFERLLSWSKPEAPFEWGTREYEWYDHNSLLADEPELRALVPAQMDRDFVVPSRAEMEAGMAAFAGGARLPVRFGCTWEATRREGDDLVLATSDGEYRCRAAVFALGVTEPWRSAIPGIEHVPHYADAGRPEDYEGRRVVVVGKRNSGFELADGLLPWARRIVLVSPRPVQTAVLAQATVRVRYFQPLEDFSLGGGTFAVDAAIERIERQDGTWRVHAHGTTVPGPFVLEADEVIAATGFTTPLRDLPDLGVTTVGQGRIPSLSPYWRAAPGIYFAGNATQGAPGLRKHGSGSSSPAVHGFRYNARVLALHLAETLFGRAPARPALQREELVPFLLRELEAAPELWAQKGYLARVAALDPPRDEGIQPLQAFVDAAGPDAVAVAVEVDAAGTIYPSVYVRRGGRLRNVDLDPDRLNAFAGAPYGRALEALVR
ncbi:MAG TPA: NAD(P)-binding domain-containing protein [Gaiellaceae bacterium]|nr:NAD(P)-binding domain-containing protein [Gaiellaceae bacterium]